ncbi:hypothetical protein ACGFWI_16195 [Streptomyces sp. NPDC048434]|uniref:hypothetical protein n=1 Tax=Streptomyces sp. NPDC048434 TaxID=3365549 RepID=UPI0037137602
MPDYFDRLLTRYAPVPPGAPPAGPSGGRAGGSGARTEGPRRALVQPRLPGPFERVEALRGVPAEPDGPAPLYPEAPRPFASEGERIRYEREIRTTERQTVLRTESPLQEAAEPERQLRPEHALLRPTAPLAPGPRPSTADVIRPQPRTRRPAGEADTARPTASTLVLPGLDAAPLAAVSMLRPRTDGLPVARGAARTAPAGRRGQRSAERVVHVQIGRLEVSAAGTERPAAGGRPARSERHAPSLSLADYLARGERTN